MSGVRIPPQPPFFPLSLVIVTADAFVFKPDSWVEPLHWEQVFTHILCPESVVPKKIHVDLGAGDGGFAMERAKNHPDCGVLAVERLLGRVRKIGRKAFHKNLENLRGLRMDIRYAVKYLFPSKSIDSLTVLFPDPWPKRRHRKNRLIQPEFLAACACVIKPDGWIALKTDDTNYFSHMEKALAACPSLQRWEGAKVVEILPEITDFERDFLSAGKPIHFLAARPK